MMQRGGRRKHADLVLSVNGACAFANMAFLVARSLATAAAFAGAVAVIALGGAVSFASWALLHCWVDIRSERAGGSGSRL